MNLNKIETNFLVLIKPDPLNNILKTKNILFLILYKIKINLLYYHIIKYQLCIDLIYYNMHYNNCLGTFTRAYESHTKLPIFVVANVCTLL